MSALSDALNEANFENWSAREIARRGGDRISHSQVNKYLKPVHPRPTERVLEVFSEVLGLPLPVLRDLAGLPTGDEEPYVAPLEANRLDRHQRDVVDELIRMLARAPAEVERAEDKVERRELQEMNTDTVRGLFSRQAEALAQRYLEAADGDAGVAAATLAHDGAKGSNSNVNVWSEALGILSPTGLDALDDERDEAPPKPGGLSTGAAARIDDGPTSTS